MNDLVIDYKLPGKIKVTSMVCGAFFAVLSVVITLQQVFAKNYSVMFFVGLAGILFSVVLILTVYLHKPDFKILINSDELRIRLRKQRIDGTIPWANVSHVGVGLYNLVITASEKTYKLDLGSVKYNDLKAIKSKIVEICESKSINYSNL